MLVIKAEIWPCGEVDERFEIARIGIINCGGSGVVADYNVISILGRDQREWVTQSVVVDHMRPLGWQPLLIRALMSEVPVEMHRKYVETVVDLLKRG